MANWNETGTESGMTAGKHTGIEFTSASAHH